MAILNVAAVKVVGLPIIVAFSQLMWLAYYAFFESSAWQATPGRRLMSVYLVSEKGGEVSLGRCVIRYVIWILPCLPYILFLMTPQYVKAIEAAIILQMPQNEARQLLNQTHLEATKQMQWISSLCAIGMFFLSCVPIVFTKQKTAVHDMLMKTRMIKGKKYKAKA